MTTNANDNEVRVLWSDIQCEYLIDQRISRNMYFFHTLHKIISFVIIRMDFSRNFSEFWTLPLRRQICFWRSVANNINECFRQVLVRSRSERSGTTLHNYIV